MKFISAALSVAVWLLTFSSAYAAPMIDTTGASFGGLLSFGEPGTATYGQTFTATGPELQLDSFMFRFDDYSSLSDQDVIDFAAYVYAWNGSMATGSQLYASGGISSTNNGGVGGYEVFSFNTGGIQLVDGQQYVVFLSTSLFFDGLSGHSAWELSNSDAYSGGNFVHMANGNDFSLLFSSTWESAFGARDLWFKANFSVPVPVQFALDIEKLTNGNQADSANDPDIPRIAQGGTVTWTYQVTNTGDVDVSEAELVVTDSQSGVTPVLDTASDTGGDLILSPGETWIYTATAQALDLSTPPAGVTVVPGCGDGRNTYENTGRVEVSDTEFFDEDQSHYCNFGIADIDIRKQEEGPDTRTIISGSDVTFEIQVTNTGATDLTNVIVTDRPAPQCNNNIGFLGIGHSVTYDCTMTNLTTSFENEACAAAQSSEDVQVENCDLSNVVIKQPIQVVSIDIVPKKDPNIINLKSGGFVPVAVLTEGDFDSQGVDPGSTRFGPSGAKAERYRIKDINRDGYPDLLLYFRIQQTGISCSDTDATLIGETSGGHSFTGKGTIQTVGCNSI